MEVRVMARQDKGIWEIARERENFRNAVRWYLRETSTRTYKARPLRPSKLELYKDFLNERIRKARPTWLSAMVLLSVIRAATAVQSRSSRRIWHR